MSSVLHMKLRILCLHGYRQTGDMFKDKTGSLRKIFKKNAEFVYMTAPLKVLPIENSDREDGGCGWWFSRKDDFFKADFKSDYVKGFEQSLMAVEDIFEKEGPFDGILGFSQGAAMVALLCLLQESKKLNFNFKFAIIAAGFKSQSTPHESIYSSIVTIPTLHIIGETDKVISKIMSEELLQYFKNPTILEHSGGHFVPASTPQKSGYLSFIGKMKEFCTSYSQDDTSSGHC